MNEKKEKEWNVIVWPVNEKAVRWTAWTADPLKLKDELQMKYGKDATITMHNEDDANKIR